MILPFGDQDQETTASLNAPLTRTGDFALESL